MNNKKMSSQKILLRKKDFEASSPPSVFIGSKLKYPQVNIGVLSLKEISDNVWLYSAPNYWSKEGIPKEKIVDFRKGLINSRIKQEVTDVRKSSLSTSLLRRLQEIGMSSYRADVEIKLKRAPNFDMKFNERVMPIGYSASLKELRIISNSRIPTQVDKVYGDTDLKSAEAIKHLYKKGFDEHYLKQLLSVGVTGLGINRKLVPTRNSITAVDDLLGKHLIEKIKTYNELENYEAYFGGHLGNYYLVMFFPDVFSYELFEMPTISKGKLYMTDYESHNGRKSYVNETAGGYYAARLAVTEHLNMKRRRASALTLRFILPTYKESLGVWVCRNSVRKALGNEKREFSTKEEMINHSLDLATKNFGVDLKEVFLESKLLSDVKKQKKLSSYF